MTGIGKAQRLLQVLNQDVVEIDADRPQEKQTGHQHEWDNVSAFRERRGCVHEGGIPIYVNARSK